MRFKVKRCATLEQVRAWVENEQQAKHGEASTDTDKHRPTKPPSVKGRERLCESVPRSEELVANAALSLLNLACYFLDRQLAAQAAAFETEGGFTERLYRVRSQKRTGFGGAQ